MAGRHGILSMPWPLALCTTHLRAAVISYAAAKLSVGDKGPGDGGFTAVAQARKSISWRGGLHAAPTLTHSLVRGQQTSPSWQLPCPEPWQNTPGLVGVRQCRASGQPTERCMRGTGQ